MCSSKFPPNNSDIADIATKEDQTWKKLTKDDIYEAVAATEKIGLVKLLYKMDVHVPLAASNQTVIKLAKKVIDDQLRDMEYVDAAASYDQWESPDRWIPRERPGACQKEERADNQEALAEL